MGRAEIERALAMRLEGKSIRAIAIAMRTPRATIARALTAVSQKGGPKESPDSAHEE